MVSVAFIGAGSTIFAKRLLTDILSFPEFGDASIRLFDIDPERLRTSEIVARQVALSLGAHPVIQSTLDRQAALEGADYAITMFQVGGYKPATLVDFDIPKRYGLRQTIGDTLGIGGILRGLRTIPVLVELCRDMEKLCPDALLMNYVNPMAMGCWALHRSTPIRTVGLCHSVQNTVRELSADTGVPFEEIDYLAAGINHMAFFLKLERDRQSIYPLVEQVIAEGRVPDWNRVRYEMYQRLGYFVTESSEHFSEYVPWFIKRDRPDLIERFNIPLDEYLRRCEKQIAGWEELRSRLESGDAALETKRSQEYAALIIHSMETGSPRVVYGNVPNLALIDNLPAGCCVELPCLVDTNGIQPVHLGALPPHLAALMQTNINVQALTVEAALTRKREHIYHAAMLDPHTAAELDLDQIWQLVDDLIEAHSAWLPEYS
jgi:alpha-galactosidase